MGKEKISDLKKKIIEEMTVDYASALEKNSDLAKQFVRITITLPIVKTKNGCFKVDSSPLVKAVGT